MPVHELPRPPLWLRLLAVLTLGIAYAVWRNRHFSRLYALGREETVKLMQKDTVCMNDSDY